MDSRCSRIVFRGAASSSRWSSASLLRQAALCANGSLPATASPRRPGKQLIPDGSPPRRPGQQQLRHSTPASNKPHLAEKSTPVWLAIWHIWAGFANSQHRDAAFATPENICAHSSLLPPWADAQTDANLSAHLHRLPTPPPYLRPMMLLHGRVRRCWVLDEAVASQGRRCWMANAAAAWPGAAFVQITARTNPCSRHLWGTLARAVASICVHRAPC